MVTIQNPTLTGILRFAPFFADKDRENINYFDASVIVVIPIPTAKIVQL
jgi:hypothetical protein